jgi:predicted RNase H-like nuclease (RuvC/YqgF family)
MKQVILPLIFAASIFSSCRTSQKLNTIDEEMMTLKSQVIALHEENTSLSRKVSESEKQIEQLQTENALYKREAENYRKAKDAIARNMEAKNNMFGNKLDSLRGF